MCVAIYQSAGKKVTKEQFMSYGRSNPDGFGSLVAKDEGILTKYRTMDLEQFWNKYEEDCRLYPNSPMLVHFRAGTAGRKDIENCHPFSINNDLGFIHNGVISKVGKDDEFSDTNLFNRKVLTNLGHDIMTNKVAQRLVLKFIGEWNKLLFLDSKKNFLILNEKQGEWIDGVWYSFKKSPAISNIQPIQTQTTAVEPVVKYKMCKLCKKMKLTTELYTISTPHFDNHVCLDCLNEETKISDICYVPRKHKGVVR